MIKTLQQITKYKKELSTLEDWFLKYDMQTHQYDRDIRTNGESSIDIKSLDAEAYENAARIKELRALVVTEQEEMSKNLMNFHNVFSIKE
jgi:hypothetical protein